MRKIVRKILNCALVVLLLLALAAPACCLDMIMNYCDDVNKYDDMMARLESEGHVPENFIYWSDISFLGDFGFCHLFYLVDYYYHIENGRNDFMVYVDHNAGYTLYDRPLDSYPVHQITGSMKNMVYSHAAESQYIIDRDGILYYYKKSGKLFSICWYKDGVQLRIYMENFDPYAKGAEETALGKLLSLDKEQFESVRTQLEPEPVMTQPSRNVFVAVSMAAVAALVAAALIGVLKRKPEEIAETYE